jgi:hypothetical protein
MLPQKWTGAAGMMVSAIRFHVTPAIIYVKNIEK